MRDRFSGDREERKARPRISGYSLSWYNTVISPVSDSPSVGHWTGRSAIVSGVILTSRTRDDTHRSSAQWRTSEEHMDRTWTDNNMHLGEFERDAHLMVKRQAACHSMGFSDLEQRISHSQSN